MSSESQDQPEQTVEPTIDFYHGIEPPRGGLEGGIEALEAAIKIDGAYLRWCGKSDVVIGQRTESIMVSCPMPNHPDKNPSAWLNTDKDLWFCGACQAGGDAIDLAAIAHGADFPGYRRDKVAFAKVLEAALWDVGIDPETLRVEGFEGEVSPSAAAPAPAAAVPTTTTTSDVAVASAQADPDDDDFDDPLAIPDDPFDWRETLDDARGSFLDVWMERTSVTDLPDEFLFWVGMQLVGLACGRNCYLNSSQPVYPNMMMVLLGDTGSGKSRSIRLGTEVLLDALPHDPMNFTIAGVKKLGRPASGEALYDQMSWHPIGSMDPMSVTALLEVDEMKELMDTANRRGSTLVPALQTITDSPREVSQDSRTGGSVRVVEPFLAVVCGGQPDAMGSILARADVASGLANRFIYVPSTRKPRQKFHETVQANLVGLADELRQIRDWCADHRKGLDGGSITMDLDAGDRFDEMCEWLDAMKLRPDGDMYARLELHAMKLVTILAINRGLVFADMAVVEKVEKLISHTIRATDQVSESLTLTRQEFYRRAVMRSIESARSTKSIPPTPAEINRSIAARKRDSYAVGVAIKDLERAGLIQSVSWLVQGGKDGRAARAITRWCLANEERWWP